MTIVNIHEAKTQLSKLLLQVQAGEEVVIAKAGVPIADLKPYHSHQPIIFGLAREKFTAPIPDSATMGTDPDIQAMFYGPAAAKS